MINSKEIGGHTYAFGKMDARRQFHVARRVGPLLALMGNVAAAVAHIPASDEAKAENAQNEEAAGRFLLFMGPLAEKLQEMSDEDLDYVINACLSVTSRKEGERWAPMMAADGRSFMFQDLALPQLLQLTVESLRENLGNFFDTVGGALA